MGAVMQMTIFVWVVNALIFMSQIAMLSIDSNANTFYSSQNTVFSQYSMDGNITMPNQNMAQSELTRTNNTASAFNIGSTGVFFIDAIGSILNWFSEKASYFVTIVMGPYNILNSIHGLPKQFVAIISLIWYGASLLLLTLTIFGRQT